MNMNHGWRAWRAGIGGVAAWLVIAAPHDGLRAESSPPPTVPRILKVAVTPIASVVEWKGDRPIGAMVSVWEELTRRLGTGSEYVRGKNFVELMDMVRDGRTDVALGPLAITEEREKSFDLTHPVFHSGMRIAIRQRNEGGLLPAIGSMVSWRLAQLLAVVLSLSLLSGHLLWWSEKSRNPRSFPPEYPRGVIEAMWWIASTIVTGGCDDKHVDGPLGRTLAFAWMIGGIGLIAAFTSVLTATMTAEQVTGLIQGPRDLAGRAVGCQVAAVTVQSIKQRGGFPQEYPTIQEALAALSLGMVDAVVCESESLMHTIKESGLGGVKLVGPMFDAFDYGIGLPNGSPLRESLNTAILRMREDGSLARIKESWLGVHD
jgi:ABC-type amino acid transport substrate-binding protein